MKTLYSLHSSILSDEYPKCGVEVRDECMLHIISEDATDTQIKQGLVDSFLREPATIS